MFFACQEEKREYEIVRDNLKECPFCGTPGKVYFTVLEPCKGRDKRKYRIVTGCPNPKCQVQLHVDIVGDCDKDDTRRDIQHTIDIWEGNWDRVETLNPCPFNMEEAIKDGWTFEDIDMNECPWCHEKARVGWVDFYKILDDGTIRHSYDVGGGCFNPDCKIGHTIGEFGGWSDECREAAIRRVVRRWNEGGEYK